MFYLKKNIDINSLKIQDAEVDYITFKSIEEIEEIMDSDRLSSLTAVGENIGISEVSEEYINDYIEFFTELFTLL